MEIRFNRMILKMKLFFDSENSVYNILLIEQKDIEYMKKIVGE